MEGQAEKRNYHRYNATFEFGKVPISPIVANCKRNVSVSVIVTSKCSRCSWYVSFRYTHDWASEIHACRRRGINDDARPVPIVDKCNVDTGMIRPGMVTVKA